VCYATRVSTRHTRLPHVSPRHIIQWVGVRGASSWSLDTVLQVFLLTSTLTASESATPRRRTYAYVIRHTSYVIRIQWIEWIDEE